MYTAQEVKEILLQYEGEDRTWKALELIHKVGLDKAVVDASLRTIKDSKVKQDA